MSQWKRLACLCVVVLVLGCVQHEPVGGASSAIVDGRLDTAHRAVVRLLIFAGGGVGSCTGSIIAPRLVLTAKHCVQAAPNVPGPAAASAFRVYVTDAEGRVERQLQVSEVRAAPGRWDLQDASDVALLVLSTPAPVEPLPVSFDDPATLAGQEFTAVGYGETPNGYVGARLETTKTVQGLRYGFIFVEPAVCQGDSGGPILGADGRIWGVASFIIDPSGTRPEPVCGLSPGAYNPVERFQGFVEQGIEDAGGCVPLGEELCNGLDDDCDEVVDEGCVPYGAACTADDECVGQLCDDTSLGRICTQECDPLNPELGCPPGLYCDGAEDCSGRCVPGAPGVLGLRALCESDTDCLSLFCADAGDGTRRCLAACQGDQGMCLSGEVCAAPPGACGSCVREEHAEGLRGLGEACRRDDECISTLCFEDEGNAYCSRACQSDDDCSESFHCRTITLPGTMVQRSRCVQGARQGLGGACVTNDDCGDGLFCAAREGARWCTPTCEGEDACPGTFECESAGDVAVCAPKGGLLGEPCGEGRPECISGLCANTGDGSICTRYCGTHNRCEPGFECAWVDATGQAVCVRASGGRGSGGGCAVSRVGAPVSLSTLILMALAVVRRRRRRLRGA